MCAASASSGRWPAGAADSPAPAGGPASSAARRFETAFPGKKIDGTEFVKDTVGVLVASDMDALECGLLSQRLSRSYEPHNKSWLIENGQCNSKQLNKYSFMKN